MKELPRSEETILERELDAFLLQLDDWLEMPLIVLAFGWLALLIVEVIWGLSPLLQTVSTTIWIIFIVDFLLRLMLAPHKGKFLRSQWLTALSLALPALRIFRLTRALRLLRLTRTVRGLYMVRIISSLNRGMSALRATMRRRGTGYVAILTLVVMLVGAAGMYIFESNLPGGAGFDSYGEAVWWTAMLLTTVGSEYWPQTAEGRLLCFLISLYGLGILGYVAATLATFFVGRDAADETAEIPNAQAVQRLEEEIRSLQLTLQQREHAEP